LTTRLIRSVVFGDMKMNRNGKPLAVWGVGLQFRFLVGLAGTAMGMLRALAELSRNGEAQPGVLASDISLAPYATAGGMLLSLVGDEEEYRAAASPIRGAAAPEGITL